MTDALKAIIARSILALIAWIAFLIAVVAIQNHDTMPDVSRLPVCVVEDSSNGNEACMRVGERQTIVNYPNGTYLVIPK